MPGKPRTEIKQNFSFTPEGQIIGPDNKTLPVREGITPATLPEKRKKANRTLRWHKGSYLTQQQATDENYQEKMKIR